MKQTIKLLDDETINQIAAGEVIVDPSSVIKELIDNSLDAGARSISITVTGSGRESITIQDDGFGMQREDLASCLMRHATSKIRSEQDLWKLQTMGFRGEALSAISAVSNVSIHTAYSESIPKGDSDFLGFSEISDDFVDQSEKDVIPHTTYSRGVTHFSIDRQKDKNFANPRKSGAPKGQILLDGHFLSKQDGKEIKIGNVKAFAGTKIIIENLFYNVPARRKFLGSLQKDAREIRKMVSLLALSRPDVSFSLKTNGVAELSLEKGSLKKRIQELFGVGFFKDLLEVSGEIVSGFISCPTVTRPNRTHQYLFINQRPVFSPMVSRFVKDGYGSSLEEGRYPLFFLYLQLDPKTIDINVHPQKKEVRFSDEELIEKIILEAIQNTLFVEKPQKLQESFVAPVVFFQEQVIYKQKPLEFRRDDPSVLQPSLFDDDYFDYIGTFDEYILVKNLRISKTPQAFLEDGLTFIHLRYAKMRIFYEELKNKPLNTTSQALTSPVFIELTCDEALAIQKCIPFLQSRGFDMREFGKNAFLIEAVPVNLLDIDFSEFFQELVRFDKIELFFNEIADRICQKEARFFKKLTNISSDFAKKIVKKLFLCHDPFFLPSGEKIIVQMSATEIEKKSVL